MNISKFKITSSSLPPGFETLAYLYPGETQWRDPHGGDFTAGEQSQFTGVALGHLDHVRLHAGTRHEKVLHVRFAAEF